MAELLRQLKRQDITSEPAAQIDKLLIAFLSLTSPPAPSVNLQLSSPLTERELQVLGLLATKLSTGEIADQLFVSINTVRMHTKSVYSKLDVHSRLEAIERARELELI